MWRAAGFKRNQNRVSVIKIIESSAAGDSIAVESGSKADNIACTPTGSKPDERLNEKEVAKLSEPSELEKVHKPVQDDETGHSQVETENNTEMCTAENTAEGEFYKEEKREGANTESTCDSIAVESCSSEGNIAHSSPGSKPEEELHKGEFAKPRETSELAMEKDHKQEEGIRAYQDEEKNNETSGAVEEFKDEQKEDTNTEPENTVEPTPGASCSTCSDYMVWNSETQEHEDVKQEVLFLKGFYSACSSQAESSNGEQEPITSKEPVNQKVESSNEAQEPTISKEPPNQKAESFDEKHEPKTCEELVKPKAPNKQPKSADSAAKEKCRNYIVPDENGQIFKGKRPAGRKSSEKSFKGSSRESAVSMPKTKTKRSAQNTQPSAQDTSAYNNAARPVIGRGYWSEDKDTIPSNDDDGKFRDIVFRLGQRDAQGNNIIVVNAAKLPQSKHFTNKSEKKKTSKSLASYIQIFIESYVDSYNFVVLVHPGHENKCRFKNSGIGKEIYNMLKNCYSDRLLKCIIYKPGITLRAFVGLARPFLKREMREKIFLSRTEQDLELGFGLPIRAIQSL